MNKRHFIIDVLIVWFIAMCVLLGTSLAHASRPSYAILALQAGVDGEGNAIYTLINGAQEKEVSTGTGVVWYSAGAWDLVVFQITEIKPDGMTLEQAAKWLSEADGFVAFDPDIIAYYASQSKAITNRAFSCQTVWLAAPMKWWTAPGGEITENTGTRSDWIAAGATVFCRSMPMPIRSGRPNSTY